MSVHVDQPGHHGLAAQVEPADAGSGRDPAALADGGDAVVGDQDVAVLDHLVAVHRDHPGAGEQDRPRWPCPRRLDDDVDLLWLGGVDPLTEELRAPRPTDAGPVARPGRIVAAFERQPLHGHRRGVAATALNLHLDGLAAGPGHADQVMPVLQVDKCSCAVGRQHDVVGRRRVVARTHALHAQQRPSIEAAECDRLQSAVGREVDPGVVVHREVQPAAPLRRGDQRLCAALGRHPTDLDGVGRRDSADLSGALRFVVGRRRAEQDRIDSIGRCAGEEGHLWSRRGRRPDRGSSPRGR